MTYERESLSSATGQGDEAGETSGEPHGAAPSDEDDGSMEDGSVLFTAAWSPACQLLERYGLSRAADRTIDVERHPEIADRWQVAAVPCLIRFSAGAERRRAIGVAVVEELRDEERRR